MTGPSATGPSARRPSARGPSAPAGDRSASALDWFGVALIGACAVLAAIIAALLVPLYAGTVIVPVSVVLAVGGNVLFPVLARRLVPRTAAALVPLLAWLVAIIWFGVVTRPEGDVILPGAPRGAEVVTYLVLLGGALAGTVTVVLTTPPPATRDRGRVSR